MGRSQELLAGSVCPCRSIAWQASGMADSFLWPIGSFFACFVCELLLFVVQQIGVRVCRLLEMKHECSRHMCCCLA